ncbi:hypothetical protein NDU88_002052 [Pleurodeles waltl]|uniref:Uncharacterized protein n=1 Tax=Pleurodeles waltl TaxID=8319 RepID=A0AAV7MQI3_PLEWA|nr:hypothetical protein NDU88_002052 [Pleurodeles waltl]
MLEPARAVRERGLWRLPRALCWQRAETRPPDTESPTISPSRNQGSILYCMRVIELDS